MTDYKLNHNTVHIFRLFLPERLSLVPALTQLLSQDEIERARRFYTSDLQNRFILTRGILRKTLSLYTNIPPEQLQFTYGEHGKPKCINNINMTFNISHSNDYAVFALGLNQNIGIDIEFKQTIFKEKIARRFFHPDEYHHLMKLNDDQRIAAFYKIWSKKEALVKLLGEALLVPFQQMVILPNLEKQTIVLNHKNYFVESISIHPEYECALATEIGNSRIVYLDIAN